MDRILSILALVIAIGAGALGYVMIDRQKNDIATANQKIDQLSKMLADTQKTVITLGQDVAPLLAMVKEQSNGGMPDLDMTKLTPDANQKYLDDFAKQDRVVKLPDGAMYRVEKNGDSGGKKPKLGGAVTVNYHVEFIDGTVLDDSQKHGGPAQMKLEGVIPGWLEILPMMKEGDAWTVVLPAKLCYGETGNPPAGQTLVFKIELLKVDS